MINYSTYCTQPLLSKKEQRNIFKEIEVCKKNIKDGKEKIKFSDKIIELNNKIVNSYIPIVIRVIQKYKANQSIDTDDLLQEGILALYYALTKFNYKRNNKFLTYALPWIKFKIDLASKNQYALNIPPNYLRMVKKYQTEENKLKNEIAGMKFKHPISYISLQDSTYLDNKVTNGLSIQETIPDNNTKTPWELIEKEDYKNYILNVIKTLKDKEQYIIKNRYGFNGEKLTLEEIGNNLNLSRERIFSMEKSILKKLNKRIKQYA